MTAKLIDGKAIAENVRHEWKTRVAKLREQGINPGLAVIIVGDDPASKVYVNNKIRACEQVGLYSESYMLPVETSEQALLQQIRELNDNPDIHGILVQLPVPDQIDENNVLGAISPDKDVDGFHLYNVGALVTGNTVFAPCTPYGVQCLLEQMGVPTEGQHAVVVGRSNIVGKPMAMLLLQLNATVTICTSRTRDLAQITRQADILVVATGRPQMITGDMVKEGAVVIDVGINRLDDGRLVGDVDFDSVSKKAGHITPVPGGVGPMTITMLVVNTVRAAERAETRNIKVAQLLEDKKPSLYTINADDTMQTALEMMASKKISALPVTNGNGSVIGIVSERDYVRRIAPGRKVPWDIKVNDIMTTDVIHVTKDDVIQKCMKLMATKHIRHLPVLEDASLVGILSITDIVVALRGAGISFGGDLHADLAMNLLFAVNRHSKS